MKRALVKNVPLAAVVVDIAAVAEEAIDVAGAAAIVIVANFCQDISTKAAERSAAFCVRRDFSG